MRRRGRASILGDRPIRTKSPNNSQVMSDKHDDVKEQPGAGKDKPVKMEVDEHDEELVLEDLNGRISACLLQPLVKPPFGLCDSCLMCVCVLFVQKLRMTKAIAWLLQVLDLCSCLCL